MIRGLLLIKIAENGSLSIRKVSVFPDFSYTITLNWKRVTEVVCISLFQISGRNKSHRNVKTRVNKEVGHA